MSGENKSAIQYWPEEERPHKRLINYGSNTMPNKHLRGIQIGSRCRPSQICGGFESRIAYEFGTIENLNQATVTEM